MRRAVLLAALGACVVVAGSARATSEGGAAVRCQTRPLALHFARTPGFPSGVLSWRTPRRLPKHPAGYRVYRDGKVVRQVRLRVHRLRVSFVPGRSIRFTVRVALRNGSTLACSARLRQRIVWRPPTAPLDLVVRPLADAVTLQWEPSRHGDGRLNGYRLFLNGTPLRNVKQTSLTVPVSPLRRASYAVAAIDTQGHLSALSNAVTVAAGHAAPDRPTGLAGQAVSDTQVSLSWGSSTAYGGAHLAYRVLRDGRTVTQTRATSLTVGNLAAATSYTFAVVAVDSLGYASAGSDPVGVTTQSPPSSGGAAHVFLLASTDQSFEAFQAHYREIGTVYPTYYDCDDDGTFAGRDVPLITGWARLRGVKVEARWNCQSTQTLHALLSSSDRSAALVAQMVQTAVASSWDGINLDFEAGAAADRGLFTAFVTELAAALHAQGKTLSVDVSAKTKDVKSHPRSTFYDYDALAGQADTIFVMCWGVHWSTSGPGAIDDWNWVQQIVSYLDARPNKQKYVLGFGMYGFDWPAGGGPAQQGTALQYPDVLALASQYGVQPQWDAAAAAPYFSYTDGSGVHHDVWYTDGQSIGMRVQLAHDHGFGIGLWRLGEEDPAIWGNPLLQPGGW